MIANWLGLIISFGGILVGNAIEGGHIGSLIQPTAGMIVFGGTLGATLLAHTVLEFTTCLKTLPKLLLSNDPDLHPLVKEIVAIATAARREGILGLEGQLGKIKSKFFASSLRFVIDGYDPAIVREMLEDRIVMEEEFRGGVAKVLETAGGFSPTVGILGAVLGLIHVMANLSDSSKLGAGIAVAFVATVYGVGSANLVFLPMATKMKKVFHHEMLEMQLIASGIIGIQAGLNPKVIDDRLHNLMASTHPGGGAHGAEKKAA